MSRNHIHFLKSCLLIALLVSTANDCFADAGLKHIAPDRTHFLFSGRIDFSEPASPKLSWPGSSVRANFSGSHLDILLDDQGGRNYYDVIIDGDDQSPVTIQTRKGIASYPIADTLTTGAHSLEIYKRTEGADGRTAFLGINLAADGDILPPPKPLSRRMEIYGDSITSGMGNAAALDGSDFPVADKNNYWAYGSIAARALQAELHTISQSGIGIMISWIPFTMPSYFDQLDAVGDNDSRWDFSRWTPDVVVINLMQNDSWLIDRDKKLVPVPDDKARIAAYRAFIQGIRQRYPQTYIVCTLGSMDATATEKWPNYIRSAVEQMRAAGDSRIDTLFFPFTGYQPHPRIVHHKANAQLLAEHIRQQLGWN